MSTVNFARSSHVVRQSLGNQSIRSNLLQREKMSKTLDDLVVEQLRAQDRGE